MSTRTIAGVDKRNDMSASIRVDGQPSGSLLPSAASVARRTRRRDPKNHAPRRVESRNGGDARTGGRVRRAVSVVAISLAALALLAAVVASVGTVDSGLTLDRDVARNPVVHDVAVASYADTLGVRRGAMVAELDPDPADASAWSTVILPDSSGNLLRLPSTLPRGDPAVPILAAGVLGLAVLLQSLPTASSWLLVLSTVIAGVATLPAARGALAPLLWLLPLMVSGAYAIGWPAGGWRFRILPLAGATGLLLIVWVVVSGADARPDRLALQAVVVAAAVAIGLPRLFADGARTWRAARELRAVSIAAGRPLPLPLSLVDVALPGRATARTAAMQRERWELATELHGDVLPRMARMIHHAEATGADDVAGTIRDLSDDVRSLVDERRPMMLEVFGLESAMRSVVETTEAGDPSIELRIDGSADGLPDAVAREAYRAFREALANARQHASASQIIALAELGPDHVRFRVLDDGRGIAPRLDRAVRPGHLGLIDIRLRGQSVGASVRVDPRVDGTGTEFEWRWPARSPSSRADGGD
jgi:signal transduction histidine kinase